MSVWKLDPAHSSVEFAVKHMMITTVRGRFKGVQAVIEIDEAHPEHSSVVATIDAASLDTGNLERDAHLRSAEFFDVERYPTITFRSKQVIGAHAKEGDHFQVVGDLTIRDTTIELPLDVIFEGVGTDPWGHTRAGFRARAEIDRRDWGLRWNQVMETGGMLVANKVRIEIEAQCVQQSTATAEVHAPAPTEERPTP